MNLIKMILLTCLGLHISIFSSVPKADLKEDKERKEVKEQVEDLLTVIPHFTTDPRLATTSKIQAAFFDKLHDHPESVIARDAFIEAVVEVVSKKVLTTAFGTPATVVLGASDLADKASHQFDKLPAPKVEAQGIWHRTLEMQQLEHHIDTQSSLNMMAAPTRTVHLVTGVLSKWGIRAADASGITQANLEKIGNLTHDFITKKAPAAIKKNYNSLIDGAIDLNHYFASAKKITTPATMPVAAQFNPQAHDLMHHLSATQVVAHAAQSLPLQAHASHVAPPEMQAASRATADSKIDTEIEIKLKAEVRKLTNKIDTVVAMNGDLKRLQDQHAKQADIRTLEHRIENERKALQQIGSDAVTGFSTLARMAGNQRTAHKIERVGSGALKIADGIMAIQGARALSAASSAIATGQMAAGAASACSAAAGIGPLAAIHPAVGIGVGVIMIASAFMESDEESSGDTELLQHISEKMDVYYQNIMRGQAIIDAHLDEQDRMMIENFCKLHKSGKNIRADLKKLHQLACDHHKQLQGNIEHLGDKLTVHHHAIADSLESLRHENTQDLIAEALDRIKDPHLSNEKFAEYFTRLVIKACDRAKDDAVTGAAVDTTSDEAVILALNKPSKDMSIWAHPVFGNINLIVKQLAKSFGKKAEPLSNPLIWIKCTQTAIALLQEKLKDPCYPLDEATQKLDLEKLRRLEEEGENLAQFFAFHGRNNPVGLMARDYERCMLDLGTLVRKEIEAYDEPRMSKAQEAHKKEADEQIAAVKASPTDCSESLRQIEETVSGIRSLVAHGHSYPFYGILINYGWDTPPPKKILPVRALFNNSPEINEIAERLRTAPISTVFNPQAQLIQDQKDLINYFSTFHKQKAERIQANVLTTDLIPLDMPAPCAFPADQQKFKAVLKLPKGILPAKIQYCTYTIKDGFFHLKGYCHDGNAEKEIYVGRIKYEPSTPLTDVNIQLLQWWNGGRYAKNSDYMSERSVKNFGYYPPVKPYKGMCDQWNTAEILVKPDEKELNELITANYTKKGPLARREFTHKLRALTVPSSNCAISKALQRVDRRLLETQSLATLLYNESIGQKMRTECGALFNQRPDLLTNSQAINGHLEEYVKPASTMANEPYALVPMLHNAGQSILQDAQTLARLPIKPRFNQGDKVLANLAHLRATYASRLPGKYTPEFRQLEQQNLFPADRKKIHTLIAEYLQNLPAAANPAPTQSLALVPERDSFILQLQRELKELRESNTVLHKKVDDSNVTMKQMLAQMATLTALLTMKTQKPR